MQDLRSQQRVPAETNVDLLFSPPTSNIGYSVSEASVVVGERERLLPDGLRNRAVLQ